MSSDFRKGVLTFNSSYIGNQTWQEVTIQGGIIIIIKNRLENWKFAWENFSMHLIFASVYPRNST